MIRFIGDVHARFDNYKELIKGSNYSIQVGDFGIGFEKILGQELPRLDGDHYFIRGNHDNPDDCKLHPNWLPDGTCRMIDGKSIFCVGGAYSVDQHSRIEGRDWWATEELTIAQFSDLIDQYEQLKPDVVVSHDCPSDIRPLSQKLIDYGWKSPSRTSQALQAMFEIHQPKLWVFGHYHTDYDEVIQGTRFVCVNKDVYRDLDLNF